MKKFQLFALALLAGTMISCSSSSDDPTPEPDPTPGGKTELSKPAPTVSAVQSDGFTVSWTAVANAESYNYVVGDQPQVNTSALSVKIDGLMAETEYTVKVQAVPASGSESYSASAWATVTAKTGSQQVNPVDNASLNGQNYLVVALDETTLASISGRVAADWRVDDVTKFLYVWEGTYSAGESVGPNFYGETDGYTALVVGNVGWSGAGFCVGVSADDNNPTPEAKAVRDELNEWLPKMSADPDNWYFHFAMKSKDNGVHEFVLYPTGGGEAKITVGVPGDANDYHLTRDGEWQEFEVPMRVFVDKGLFYRAEYDNVATNVMAVLSGAVAGTELNLDAVFFYQK